jgi:hypothetical protein
MRRLTVELGAALEGAAGAERPPIPPKPENAGVAIRLRGGLSRSYYLMAVALPRPEDPLDFLLSGSALRVSRGNGVPPLARGGSIAGVAEVDVRPPRNTEPPVLLALPALQPKLLTAPGHP